MIGERLDHPLELDRRAGRTQVEPEAPRRGTARRGHPYTRVVFLLTTLVAMSLLCLAYTRVSYTFDVNSDNASIVLQAESFVRGNYLLRGWHLSTVPFLVELPFYGLGILLVGGIRPVLMYVIPALFTTLAVALAVWLAGRGRTRRFAALGRVITFLLIGLPSSVLASHCLRGPGHLVTVVLLVAALLVIDSPGRFLASPTRPILLTVLFAAALYNDRLALFVLVLPLVLVCLMRLIRQGRRESGLELRLLGASIVAFGVSKVIPAFIAHAGGYHLPGVGSALITLPNLHHNIRLAIGGLLDLTGANFIGQPLGVGMVLSLLHLPGLALILFSLGRVLVSWRARRGSADLVPQVLAAGMVANLAGYLASVLPYDLDKHARAIGVEHYLMGLGVDVSRYLLPFVIFGAILAGRVGLEHLLCRTRKLERKSPRFAAQSRSGRGAQRYVTIGLLALGLVHVCSFAQRLCSPLQTPSRSGLCEWLRGRGLRYGYSSFWNANIVTVLSEGETRIRAVTGDDQGIGPRQWLNQEDWYNGTPANFLVLDQVNYDGVDGQRAVRFLGRAAEGRVVGEFFVGIWDKDLTPLLRAAVK